MVQYKIKADQLFIGYGLLLTIATITAIILDQPMWLAIPFLALLIPVVINYPRFLFILLLATLPLSAELQVTKSLGTDFPDEFIMWAITGVFFMLAMGQSKIINDKFYRHPLLYLLGVYIFWIAVTLIFSEQPLLSIKYLLAKVWYIVPFVFFLQIFMNGKRPLFVLGL